MAGLLTGCSATDSGSPASTPSTPTASAATATPGDSAQGTATQGTTTPGATATGSATATASRVVLTRTGGFAGRADTVTVEPDGRWTATDVAGATRTGQLAPGELDRLHGLAGTVTMSGGAADTGSCADAFTYRVAVGANTVNWTDCGPPPPAAAPAVADLLLSAAALD
ncbi:hypothetical protein ABZ807_00635 [Micromonospora sp. NPDC047548]|uniref:hypothetical protein n=1 Tax=Micromonospora sp. NPDC047548 TaxID=3155624 RepID=UPI0033F95702